MNILSKLRGGLAKTRQKLGDNLRRVLRPDRCWDEALLVELEEALLTADVGVGTTEAILKALHAKRKERRDDLDDIKSALLEVIEQIMLPAVAPPPLNLNARPSVILVVGVNGSGKTTSIAKLAYHFRQQGKRVLLAAADTFRAAAAEQLLIWGERLGMQVIHQKPGSDPAAVAYDAFQSARARNYDLLIVDTAGRLHNKANLMQELNKIARVLKKQDSAAPHEVLLVLDANIGQNALQQARVFREICGVSGLILAKLDGTARGGVVISICRELNLPLRYIGLGEKLDDLQPFDPSAFARALLEPVDSQT